MAAERGEPVRREDLPQSRYSYDYKHDLLDAARGKARDHKCEACAEKGVDRQALEWSQLHDRTGDDPWDYRALCKPCHQAYDGHYPPVRVGGNPDLGQTRAAQQRAKTHCPHGHEFTEDNIYWRGPPENRTRQCKTCTRERAAARHQAQREAAALLPKPPSRRGGARPGTGDPDLGRRSAERQLAKTHCPAGHEYSEENTYIIKRPGGRTARQCKICTKAKAAVQAATKRSQKAAGSDPAAA